MLTVRKSGDRGHIQSSWLDTRHSFSFGDYHDPKHMGFGNLRVINQDVIKAGAGFGTHPHRDMEIITYVTHGAVAHRDSLGNEMVVKAGEVQRMTAGTGVSHSEYNDSADEALKLLQIWILPDKKGLKPGYEEIFVADEDKIDRLKLIASSDGREGSVMIHQDVLLYASILSAEASLDYSLANGRKAWVQVISGKVDVNGQLLEGGDGVAVEEEEELMFVGRERAEFLVFDLG